jgi:hypothetical protein
MPHRSQYTVFASVRANGAMSACASNAPLWRKDFSCRKVSGGFQEGGIHDESIRPRHEHDAYAHGEHADRAAEAGDRTAVKGERNFGWRAARGDRLGRDNHAWHGALEVVRVGTSATAVRVTGAAALAKGLLSVDDGGLRTQRRVELEGSTKRQPVFGSEVRRRK